MDNLANKKNSAAFSALDHLIEAIVKNNPTGDYSQEVRIIQVALEGFNEAQNLKDFAGLYTGFNTESKEINAARYDGFLDGIQVGMQRVVENNDDNI